MRESPGPGWQLTTERMLWLACGLALVVAPHATRVPLWVSACFAVFAGWRVLSLVRGTRLPRQPFGVLLGLAVVAGVYLSYGTVFGRNPGVALLVALTGMKLLETRSRRDAFAGILLGYFLVITNFLYSQTIPTGIYMFVVVVAMTAALVGLNTPPGEIPARRRLWLAGSLLVQAVPVMLVLFVLFPRISGPLWGLPEDARGAVTGLTDTMSPGSISSLSESDAVAFRVRFDGPVPPPANRYWRGPVLWRTDGRSWSRGNLRGKAAQPVIAMGPRIWYTVTLEPDNKRWLFLLDAPSNTPEGSSVQHDYVVLARSRVRERLRYRAASVIDYRLPLITAAQRNLALQLPPGAHPRARALAQEWLADKPRPAELVQRALSYFHDQPFFYTLEPPLTPGDSVDQFLFDTRRGFCEHYAAALTVLMRAAGVPARIVTGYQGGEINPVDGYLVVRQRDAHAWVEVWEGKAGWVRVDPTAAVSPSRIEQGADTALPRRVTPLIGLSIENTTALYNLLHRLRFGWEAMNNWWNQWVLGYGPSRQKELLSHMGLNPRNWRQISTWLLALTAAPLLAVALWLRHRLRGRPDRARRLYDRFCHKLARRGMVRRPSEGPVDFARRASRRLPRHAGQILRITRAYLGARYGRGVGDTRHLRALIAGFNP